MAASHTDTATYYPRMKRVVQRGAVDSPRRRLPESALGDVTNGEGATSRAVRWKMSCSVPSGPPAARAAARVVPACATYFPGTFRTIWRQSLWPNMARHCRQSVLQIPVLLWLMMPGDGFSSRQLGYRLVLRGGMGQHSDVDTGESEWVHWQVARASGLELLACMSHGTQCRANLSDCGMSAGLEGCQRLGAHG